MLEKNRKKGQKPYKRKNFKFIWWIHKNSHIATKKIQKIQMKT